MNMSIHDHDQFMEHEGERTMYHDYPPPHEYPHNHYDDFPPPRIMVITLMTTILVDIWNLFAVIILKTYMQSSSFTLNIVILMMTLARLVTAILPLRNSSMSGLVVNSKSISVTSIVLNAKRFQASVQKGQNLELTPPNGRT